jgi:hypothetical protein
MSFLLFLTYVYSWAEQVLPGSEGVVGEREEDRGRNGPSNV